MPYGGNTPLDADSEEWKCIKRDYFDAVNHGMQIEWLQWMLGGVIHNKLPLIEASENACIEWDF